MDTEPGIPAVPGQARWPWWTPAAAGVGGLAAIGTGLGLSILAGPLPMFDGIRALLSPPQAPAPAWDRPAPLLSPTTSRQAPAPERTTPPPRPPATTTERATPATSQPPAPTTTPPRATPTPPPGGMGGGDDPPTTTQEATSATRSEVPADPTPAPDPSGDPPRRTPADEPPRTPSVPPSSRVPGSRAG